LRHAVKSALAVMASMQHASPLYQPEVNQLGKSRALVVIFLSSLLSAIR